MRRSRTDRSSALWGTGSRGESRSKFGSGRKLAATLGLFALAAPMLGLGSPGSSSARTDGAFVPASLLEAARANPAKQFAVIVQGDRRHGSQAVAERVRRLTDEV